MHRLAVRTFSGFVIFYDANSCVLQVLSMVLCSADWRRTTRTMTIRDTHICIPHICYCSVHAVIL